MAYRNIEAYPHRDIPPALLESLGITDLNVHPQPKEFKSPLYLQRHDGKYGDKIGRIYRSATDEITLYKNQTEADNQLHTPPGWAMDRVIIKAALEEWVTSILIHAYDSNRTYRTSLRYFLEKCKLFQRGHGKQLRMDLEFWEMVDPNQMELW